MTATAAIGAPARGAIVSIRNRGIARDRQARLFSRALPTGTPAAETPRRRRRALTVKASLEVFALLDAMALEVGGASAKVAASEGRTDVALDAIALEVGAVRAEVSAIGLRTVAAERGLEVAIRSADTAASAIHDCLQEVRQLEARQVMTESALERIYGLLDTLAGHFAAAGVNTNPENFR